MSHEVRGRGTLRDTTPAERPTHPLATTFDALTAYGIAVYLDAAGPRYVPQWEVEGHALAGAFELAFFAAFLHSEALAEFMGDVEEQGLYLRLEDVSREGDLTVRPESPTAEASAYPSQTIRRVVDGRPGGGQEA